MYDRENGNPLNNNNRNNNTNINNNSIKYHEVVSTSPPYGYAVTIIAFQYENSTSALFHPQGTGQYVELACWAIPWSSFSIFNINATIRVCIITSYLSYVRILACRSILKESDVNYVVSGNYTAAVELIIIWNEAVSFWWWRRKSKGERLLFIFILAFLHPLHPLSKKKLMIVDSRLPFQISIQFDSIQ